MNTKKELRQELLLRRKTISSEQQLIFGEQAAELIAATDCFQNSIHIACYLPLPHEFDSRPLIQKIWAEQKQCYLPILAEKKLEFVSYHKNDVLHYNRYKILEPVSQNKFPLEQLDLVILPLVGFDNKGHRLGMGAGYYDRTFSITKPKILLGLGYGIQEIPDLPNDSWDVKLDGIITEQKIIFI